jgi:TatA/E family protein of Tat protein translocase
MTLLFLESVGTTELLVILIAALVLFGPRKLPELSRSLGKGLSEFKRASDEFKRTWEREVNLDSHERESRIGDAMLPPEERGAQTSNDNMIASSRFAPEVSAGTNTIARRAGERAIEPTPVATSPTPGADGRESNANEATMNGASTSDADARRDASQVAPQSPHKADWL